MKVFMDFLQNIENVFQRNRTEEILNWVNTKYPDLVPEIKYNQPMFIDHGTFIIGFSIAKNHLAISPEKKGIDHFSDRITKSGYDYTTHLMKLPWDKPIDYSLLEKVIEFNVSDKIDCTSFWRK